MPGRGAGGGGSDAGASAWAHYRALTAEYRTERIVIRLMLAGAAAICFGGFFGRWAGLAAAAAVLAAHVLRTRFRPGPVSNWRRGALAERRTGRKLAKLDPSSFHVLHDRALPDTRSTNLDHLVIGLTGVYVVVSRCWPVGTRLWVERRGIWAGRRPVTGLPVAAARAAQAVAGILTAELDHEVPVTPIVAVHRARLPHGGLRYRGVTFQRAARLVRYIGGRSVVFSSAQVATIAAAAERTLPPMLEDVPEGGSSVWR